MKLLSAIILSFGLSVSVWADNEVSDLDQLYAQLDGLVSMSCSDYLKLRLDEPELSTALATTNFQSFLSGYNLALSFSWSVQRENGILDPSAIAPIVQYKSALKENKMIVVERIDAKCVSSPTQTVGTLLLEWMGTRVVQ